MKNDASQYDDVRYLHAKRTVDDRALNQGVWARFDAQMRELRRPGAPAGPARVVELGAGVGTMVARLADRGGWPAARYTLVDRDARSLRSAAEHLAPLARPLAQPGAGVDGAKVDLVEADVFAWLQDAAQPRFDAVVACAFLDLVDLPALLPLLWRRLVPGAPFWFSINFDGETIFVPEHAADGEILARYHRTMDERVRDGRRAGESRTGRRLLELLPASGARITAAGSSDWVVWPDGGRYPGDEAYFLHHIVQTVDVALADAASLDPGVLASWVAARHAQIDRAQLCYVAHQLDVTGHAPA
jgi:SAM-dependent methyltransferase